MKRNRKIYSELSIPKCKIKKRRKMRKIIVKRKKNTKTKSSKTFVKYPLLYKIKKWYYEKKKNKKYIFAFVACKFIITVLLCVLEFVL